MLTLMHRPGDLGLETLPERLRALFEGNGLSHTPSMDLYEGTNGWRLYAELPGVRPEDLHVRIENGNLVLEVEKHRPEDVKDYAPIRQEREYGTFRRELTLPDAVDGEKIEAQFRDGVLTLALPKKEEAKPRKIEIKVS